jgi:hypothetical protein
VQKIDMERSQAASLDITLALSPRSYNSYRRKCGVDGFAYVTDLYMKHADWWGPTVIIAVASL